MKRFINPLTDGVPVFVGDFFEVLQEEQYSVIRSLLSKMTEGSTQGLVLSGVLVSGNTINFDTTPGIVFLDGDFYRIDSQAGISNPSYIVPSTSESISRTFGNLSNKQVFEIKKATVSSTIPSSGQYIVIDTIGTYQNKLGGDWVTIPKPNSNYEYPSDGNPGDGAASQFLIEFFDPSYKVKNGTVIFRGAFRVNGAFTNEAIITMPENLRPKKRMNLLLGLQENISGEVVSYFQNGASILSNGELRISEQIQEGNAGGIFLDNLQYEIR